MVSRLKRIKDNHITTNFVFRALVHHLHGNQRLEEKTSKPYEGLNHLDKIWKTELPPFDAFNSQLRSCNPLVTEYMDYANLMKNGSTTEQAVIKLKLSKPPLNGIENYQNLQQKWKQEQRSSFKDFLRWYYNKDVVPSLEAMEK